MHGRTVRIGSLVVGAAVLAAVAAALVPSAPATAATHPAAWSVVVEYDRAEFVKGVIKDYNVRHRYVVVETPEGDEWQVFLSTRCNLRQGGQLLPFTSIHRQAGIMARGWVPLETPEGMDNCLLAWVADIY